jgi:hypothetical protein
MKVSNCANHKGYFIYGEIGTTAFFFKQNDYRLPMEIKKIDIDVAHKHNTPVLFFLKNIFH